MKLDLQVRGLRFRLESSSRAVGIRGPTGIGKSTMFRGILGLEGSGVVDLDGPVSGPAWQRRLGWVPQDARLFPHLSVRDNLTYGGGSLAPVADALGLEPLLARMPRNLSGGEKQRVALGRALLLRPRWLLLDEPFASLDDAWAAKAASAVLATQIPFLLISHLERDHSMCDQLWVMGEGGRLVQS